MASFNKVILMGNLTRDPDVRTTGTTGMKVVRLGVAINERRKDRNGQVIDFPVFVDVDAWDRLAELCGQHLSKGSPILVEGRLQMDQWERDGVRHQKLKVRASTIKFLPRGERYSNNVAANEAASPFAAANEIDNETDEIPF